MNNEILKNSLLLFLFLLRCKKINSSYTNIDNLIALREYATGDTKQAINEIITSIKNELRSNNTKSTKEGR